MRANSVIVFALSSWLGKFWATRIADAERARFAAELEGYKNQLQQMLDDRRDALVRKRDVYVRLATSMRIFLAGSQPTSGAAMEAAKNEFLRAFDEAALWASEEVVQTVGTFLNQSALNTATPGTVSNDDFKDAYRNCLNAMRRDCGFPDTTFNYPVLTFL